jgi:hypothetical protein
VLYNRGLRCGDGDVEAVRKAQVKYGKKPLKGEEVRWGLENLSIDDAVDQEARLRRLHDAGQHQLRQPRRRGAGQIHTWDGKKWHVQPGVYHADNSILKPMIKASPRSTRPRRRSSSAIARRKRAEPLARIRRRRAFVRRRFHVRNWKTSRVSS